MMDWFYHQGLSSTQALLIIALIVVQMALMAAAFIALARSKNPQPWGLSKLLWCVIIVVANILGSILVLIAVTKDRPAPPPQRVKAAATAETIDALYRKECDE